MGLPIKTRSRITSEQLAESPGPTARGIYFDANVTAKLYEEAEATRKLRRLRFLSDDPRSPSAGIVRTPIEVGVNHFRQIFLSLCMLPTFENHKSQIHSWKSWSGKMIVVVWTAEEPWFDSWQGKEIFLISKLCRLTLGPSSLAVHWVPGSFLCWLRVTIHLHLVLRLKMHWAVPPFVIYHNGKVPIKHSEKLTFTVNYIYIYIYSIFTSNLIFYCQIIGLVIFRCVYSVRIT